MVAKEFVCLFTYIHAQTNKCNYTLLFISFISVFPEPNTEKLHRRVPFHEIARPPCCYYRLQEIQHNGVMVAANDTVFTQNVVKTGSRL
jgi:hypothetical protein